MNRYNIINYGHKNGSFLNYCFAAPGSRSNLWKVFAGDVPKMCQNQKSFTKNTLATWSIHRIIPVSIAFKGGYEKQKFLKLRFTCA